MAPRTQRDLTPLFAPDSVAIVGASNDPAKWGHWLARGAIGGEHRRAVYLVNRTGGEVLGRPTYKDLRELPERPELVVVAVPASGFEATTDAALETGARAIVAIAAGLGEIDEEGRERERAVVERVRAAGAILLGPNCTGVYDATTELDVSSSDFTPGPIGLVSQSGNLAIEVSLLAREVGLGVSRFASVGNQADLEIAELIRDLAAHVETRLIAVYCEDFRDGRDFARAAAEARQAGKPVVLLAGGVTATGLQAAQSHTGALVSDSFAVDAACRAAGIVRVTTPREIVDVAQVLLAGSRPRGPRLAIVSDGGGSGVVAADVATQIGLELPRLSGELAARLAEAMTATSTTTNPVDFAGAGEQDLSSYERVPRLLLESGEVDAVMLTGYLGGYSATADDLRGPETEAARGLARAMSDGRKPVIVQTMYWQESPAAALREGGVPVFRDVDGALRAVAKVERHERRAPTGVPELPAGSVRAPSGDGYLGARSTLAEAGVRFAEARRVETPAEAVAAADELGYPVALKALGLVHKSDAGGVVLDIPDEEQLVTAVTEMKARPAANSLVVEQMVGDRGAVELIAGCKRDARFGPVLLVGLGGIYTNVLQDTAVALAPAEPDEIESLLLELRGSALLTGARGRRAVAIRAAAEAAAAVSRFAAAHPEVAEVEVNPLLVGASSAVGLDARIVYCQPR
jgi:acyl-CoA synthetase (NDP forming)